MQRLFRITVGTISAPPAFPEAALGRVSGSRCENLRLARIGIARIEGIAIGGPVSPGVAGVRRIRGRTGSAIRGKRHRLRRAVGNRRLIGHLTGGLIIVEIVQNSRLIRLVHAADLIQIHIRMETAECAGLLFISTDGMDRTFAHPPGFTSGFMTAMHSSNIPVSQLRHSSQDDGK